MLPVCKGPPQDHPPGQLHHQGLGVEAELVCPPGPLPVTEMYLEHSTMVELYSHLCNREITLGCCSPSREKSQRLDATYWSEQDSRAFPQRILMKGLKLTV